MHAGLGERLVHLVADGGGGVDLLRGLLGEEILDLGLYSKACGQERGERGGQPLPRTAWIDRTGVRRADSGAFADLELKAHVHHRLRDAVAGHQRQHLLGGATADGFPWRADAAQARHHVGRGGQVVEAQHRNPLGNLDAAAKGLEQGTVGQVVVAEEDRIDVRVAVQQLQE
ncbi:hypothetical protein D3C78_1498030 [compost metagenome]